MYLYFDNNGILKTQIPHGEIPRQGGTFDIVVVLDTDFWSSKSITDETAYLKTLSLWYNNASVRNNINLTKIGTGTTVFTKTNDCEMTYNLVDGKEYLMYKATISPALSVNNSYIFGDVTCTVSFTTNTTPTVVIMQGESTIYIEKTYGAAKLNLDQTLITKYQEFLDLITRINAGKLDIPITPDTLPSTGGAANVYAILKETSLQMPQHKYDEYFYINGQFEKIGDETYIIVKGDD